MNPIIKAAVKQFLPDIQEKAVPMISDFLTQQLKSVVLNEQEDNAVLMLSKSGADWYVFTVTMTPDNSVSRVIKSIKMDDVVKEGVNLLNTL